MQLPQMMSPNTQTGLAALNVEITRQATMIGYLDDFRIMMMVTLVAIPLLLLIRKPARAPAPGMAADMGH